MTRDDLVERLTDAKTILESGQERAMGLEVIQVLIRDIKEEGVLDIQQPPAVNEVKWFFTTWGDLGKPNEMYGPYDTEFEASTASVDHTNDPTHPTYALVFSVIAKDPFVN